MRKIVHEIFPRQRMTVSTFRIGAYWEAAIKAAVVVISVCKGCESRSER